MSKDKTPVTPAVRMLRAAGVEFSHHPYQYGEGGGTASFARQTGVDEHSVIKTLVMEDERKNPLLVLMHGDRQVSTKELARVMGVKAVSPCDPATAQKHTGYMVGGISPFGTRRSLPVYMEETIAALPVIYVNGGKRGYLVGLSPAELLRTLRPVLVRVAI